MSSISDELQGFTNTYDLNSLQIYELKRIADRIEAETVELPCDKDGKPIHVGETVYGEDGKEWHVEGVVIGRWTEYTDSPVVYATDDSGQWRNLLPWLLTHERPDSLERIADELDEQAGSLTKDGYTCQEDAIHDFADRIRRLAEKEGER